MGSQNCILFLGLYGVGMERTTVAVHQHEGGFNTFPRWGGGSRQHSVGGQYG